MPELEMDKMSWSVLDLNKKVKIQVYLVSNLSYSSFY